MRLDYSGRHVVVTGGTGALGSAVVEALLGLGASCSIPVQKVDELERCSFKGDKRVHCRPGMDLRDEGAVVAFYEEARVFGKGLWASVHIAGGFAYAPIESVSKDAFVEQMQMNALTAFLCTREAVKAMRTAGGRVVNVAARPALEPRAGANMVPYTASKAAVAAMTQAAAEELVGRGILMNAVVPSIMDTPANRKSMPDADHSKWAKVSDVAATVVFLASPQNTCTRGGLVPVYGGA